MPTIGGKLSAETRQRDSAPCPPQVAWEYRFERAMRYHIASVTLLKPMRDRVAALTGYLAPEGFLADLQQELGSAVCETYGNLVLATEPVSPVVWTANV